MNNIVSAKLTALNSSPCERAITYHWNAKFHLYWTHFPFCFRSSSRQLYWQQCKFIRKQDERTSFWSLRMVRRAKPVFEWFVFQLSKNVGTDAKPWCGISKIESLENDTFQLINVSGYYQLLGILMKWIARSNRAELGWWRIW